MPELTDLQPQWSDVCQSAQSHAALIARSCRRKAAAMIRREADKFCQQGPPKNADELARRVEQSRSLTSKIAAILHSDQMARIHPGVSDAILQETQAFLDRVGLDNSPYEESMALTSKITSLCSADMMQKA